MKKILLPVLALGAMSSAALAEPMALTDAQMDDVTAAGFAFVDAVKFVQIREDIHKRVDIHKDVFKRQRVDVQGFFAEADAGANCVGLACQAHTFAITDVHAFDGFIGFDNFFVPTGFATSVSGSEAAAPGFVFDPPPPPPPPPPPSTAG